MALLTSRALIPALDASCLFHAVNPGDTSQNPAGSSFKATIGQLLTLLSTLTQTTPTATAVTNVTTLSGPQTINGVAVVAGDIVLLTAQTDVTQNGFWLVQNGAWIQVFPLSPLVNALTPIFQGTNGKLLYNNNGILGQLGIGSGLSVSGGNLNATSGPAPTGAPTLSLAAGNAQITVTITKGTGSTNTYVYRGTSSGVTSATGTLVYSSSGTSFTDTGLTNGTTYYYIAYGENNGAFGAASSVQNATPSALRIYDTFNVSNQTNNGRTPTTINVPGNTWSNTIGTCSVASNTIQGTSFSGYVAQSLISNGQRAASISATVYLASTSSVRQGVNVYFRYVDSSNHWYATVNANTGANYPTQLDNAILLYEMTGGVPTPRAASSVGTIATNTAYTLTISDDGTNIVASINGLTASYSSTASNTGQSVGFGFVSLDNTNYGSYGDEFKVT